MSYSINSCKNCVPPKRHPGCHDHCPEYLAQKAKHDEMKAAEKMQKAVSDGITAQRTAAVTKALKGRRNFFRNIKKGD